MQKSAATSDARAVTESQWVFRKPGYAIALGIVLPIVCLVLDPVVFRGDLGILSRYKAMCYAYMAQSMCALAIWLSLRRFPSIFHGLLFCGCMFACVLGIVLLPLSFLGIMAIIGLLGFSPFLTAGTFWHAAESARELAGARYKPAVALIVFLVAVGLPVLAQVIVWQTTDQSSVVWRD